MATVEVINDLQCKLMAISCLGEEQRKYPRQWWDSRFHAHDAFWVDAETSDTEQALCQKAIAQIQQSGQFNLSGQIILLSVFLDFNQDVQKETLENILGLADFLRRNLGCIVPLTLEFGYLGKIAFSDKAALKDRAKMAAAINNAHSEFRVQLCLVADSVLLKQADEPNWKAVMLLLDVLRRSSTPQMLVPIAGQGNPNDDVGFLRYGEYDEKKYSYLDGRLRSLQQLLSANGETELTTYLKNKSLSIESEITEKYVIDDPTCMPLPNGLICDPPTGFRRTFGGKEAMQKYTLAFNKLRNQLETTAKRMVEDIQKDYPFDAATMREELKSMMEACKVGLELQENRSSMLSLLDVPIPSYSQPMTPQRPYNYDPAETVARDISKLVSDYLRDTRNYHIGKVIHTYFQALKATYSEIQDEYYSNKRNEINAELESIRLQTEMLTSQQTFLNILTNGKFLPNTNFFPIAGGGAQWSFATCRTSEDGKLLTDNGAGNGGYKLYEINKSYGNLKTLDTAPLKAVQLLMFDCDEARLRELIG